MAMFRKTPSVSARDVAADERGRPRGLHLRTWNIRSEIQAVYQEADQISQGKASTTGKAAMGAFGNRRAPGAVVNATSAWASSQDNTLLLFKSPRSMASLSSPTLRRIAARIAQTEKDRGQLY